jgi:hypothetical protein
MKILVFAKGRAGIPAQTIQPHIKEEVQAVWDLYAQGIVREFYTRADQPGPAVLEVESPTVEAAREALAELPLVKMGLIDLDLVPLAPFTAIGRLFEANGQTA